MRKQLAEEADKIADSNKIYEEALQSAQEENNKLRQKNARLNKIKQYLIQFLRSNPDTFLGYLIRNGIAIAYPDFEELLATMEHPDTEALLEGMVQLSLEE